MARVKRICCAADVVDAYDHNIFYYTTIKQLRLVVVKLAKINIGEPKEFNVSVVGHANQYHSRMFLQNSC